MRGLRSTPLDSVPAPAAHMRLMSVPSRQCMEEDTRIPHSVGDGMSAVERISDAGFREPLQLQLLAPSAVLRPVANKK